MIPMKNHPDPSVGVGGLEWRQPVRRGVLGGGRTMTYLEGDLPQG